VDKPPAKETMTGEGLGQPDRVGRIFCSGLTVPAVDGARCLARWATRNAPDPERGID